jgi:hypothetical protein
MQAAIMCLKSSLSNKLQPRAGSVVEEVGGLSRKKIGAKNGHDHLANTNAAAHAIERDDVKPRIG